MAKAMYAGKKNDVVLTPPKLYRDLDKLFHFDFDPTPVGPQFDGLKEKWGKSNYINPPYSNIAAFIRKSLAEKKPSVFLIPYRGSSKYWREIVFPNADGFWFVDKIKFVKLSGEHYKNPFPIPIAIVFFNFPKKTINDIILNPKIKKLGDSNIAVCEIMKRPNSSCSGTCSHFVGRIKHVVVYSDCINNYAFTLPQIKGKKTNPYTGKKFPKEILAQIAKF